MKLKGNLLQVKVDVIMDWIREAHLKKETRKNSWLSYGLPIQRLRGSIHCHVLECRPTKRSLDTTVAPRVTHRTLTYSLLLPSSAFPSEFGVIGCETDKDETCTLSPQELRAFLAYL